MSSLMHSTPVTLSQDVITPVTLSRGVSHSDNSDMPAVAAAAVLNKPVTLSQDADNSADIQLETLTGSEAVSTRDTGFNSGNVTKL